MQGEASKPEELDPVLRNPNIASVGDFFGSESKNRRFEAMVDATGKAKFEWTPFEYR